LGIHVFAGGPEVHDPLLAADLSAVQKAFVSILWHAVTAVLLINSAALLAAALMPRLRAGLTGLVIAQYVAYAGLFVFYDLSRLGTLMALPQWIIFLILVALALPGLRVPRPIGT
jgi:predicted anti-sigma-YlaC factor YlaD